MTLSLYRKSPVGRLWSLSFVCSVAAHLLVLAALNQYYLHYLKSLKEYLLRDRLYVTLLGRPEKENPPKREAVPPRPPARPASSPRAEKTSRPAPEKKPPAVKAARLAALADKARREQAATAGAEKEKSAPEKEGPGELPPRAEGDVAFAVYTSHKVLVISTWPKKAAPGGGAHTQETSGFKIITVGKAAEAGTGAATPAPGIGAPDRKGPEPARFANLTGSPSPDRAAGGPEPTTRPPQAAGLQAAGPAEAPPPGRLGGEERGGIGGVSPVKAAVIITWPPPGDTDKPAARVRGRVVGEGVGSVYLSVGDNLMELPVRGGAFEAAVTLTPGRNVLTATARGGSGLDASDTVIVNYVEPEDLSVTVECAAGGAAPTIRHRWSPHPLAEKEARGPEPPEFRVVEGAGGGRVSVGRAEPGIYEVGLGYDIASQGRATFTANLYSGNPIKKKTRVVGPLGFQGKGYLRAVRVLLPEEVFWEDDGWFSGIMENGRETIKYRQPEGIVWREVE